MLTRPDNLPYAACNKDMESATEAEQNRLIVSHMFMVEPIAAEYRGRKGIPFEDLLAAGREGLVRAARNNNNPHLAKFSTYATEYIRGYVRNFIETWQHLIPIGDAAEVERNFHEWDIWGSAAPYEKWTSLTATPEDLFAAFDELNSQQMALKEAWKFLPKMERAVIELRYFRDPPVTLNSIAREFKMPYATLVDFINRTLKRLAEEMDTRVAATPTAVRG